MNEQRRLFLSQFSVVAGLAAFSRPLTSIAAASKKIYSLRQTGQKVTIYSTNDLHGKFNPVYENIGGIDHIKQLLSSQETSGLLLDGGGFFDGSSNLSRQQHVIQAMNEMGYHAAAVGNNELAHGQEYLARLAPLMKFSLVNCNYRFEGALAGLVKPYIIINSGKFKIGVTGVGQRVNNVKYYDAIQSANSIAANLKEIEKCDLVVCLSHLSYSQEGNLPDNQKLAAQSENIDLVIGGNNRKVLSSAIIKRNKVKHEVVVTQAAWDGLMLGRTVYSFENGKQKTSVKAKNFIAGETDGQDFIASVKNLASLEKSRIAV